MADKKTSLEVLAKEWDKSVDEVKKALEASGWYEKRITVKTVLDEEQSQKLKLLACPPPAKSLTPKVIRAPKDKPPAAKASPKVTPMPQSRPTPSPAAARRPGITPPPPPPPPPAAQQPVKTTVQRNIGGTQVTENRKRSLPQDRRNMIRELLKEQQKANEAANPSSNATESADSLQQKTLPPLSVQKKDTIGDPERLLKMQEAHQQQRKMEAERGATAAAEVTEKKTKKAEEKKKPAKADDNNGTRDRQSPKPNRKKIKLDDEIIRQREKRRKSRLSRSEVVQNAQQHIFQKPTEPVIREIKIPDAISVTRLANDMSLKSGVVIRKLMEHGMDFTANQLLDKETAWIIVEDLGHKPIDAPIDDAEQELHNRADADGVVREPRAPVVTVMGHVDHGKTSLLDYIRKSRVAVGEAGGITQHISSYRVSSAIGPVTFLDTPGHELFTQMRARGAKITDIVVLVVAGDDGVKPQTIEAIHHAQVADVPIVVAVNKMDKPDSDLERVKSELSSHNVIPEDWGGDAMIVPVSALTGDGIDKLLDSISTQADVLELNAPVNSPATAVVVETRLDRGRGIVATVVVTAGVLRCGAAFLCGAESGRVRAMWNSESPSVDEVHPSEPVEMQGLTGVPEAGSTLFVLEDERKARELATQRQRHNRDKQLSRNKSSVPSPSLESLPADRAAELLDAAQATEEWRELKIVVKTDVEGSREALTTALSNISGKKAGIKVVHSAVGGVTESDIYLAQTSGGVVIAFNVRPNVKARKLAESRNVRIIIGEVVYELVQKTRQAVLNLLSPIIEEKVIGNADVLKVFSITKAGNIAGCRVTDGVIRAGAYVRLVRDSVSVYEGQLSSLRHFKDEATEIKVGSECGLAIAKFNDIKVGDVIEAVERTETPPEL